MYGYPRVHNRIGNVMGSVLALIAVDHGFQPRSGHTKDYINGYLLLLRYKARSIKEKKANTGWLGIIHTYPGTVVSVS
jgi:hypothetical protein